MTRVRLGFAMLAMAILTSCSSSSPTGVRVTIDYSRSPIAREDVAEFLLAVRDDVSTIDVQSPALGEPAPATLELFFEDDTPFVNVAVAVRNGTSDVAADIDVELIRGQIVEQTLVLQDCPAECEPGDTRCSSDSRQVNVCVALGACSLLVRSDLCATDESCVSEPSAMCQGELESCTGGETRCVDGMITTCEGGSLVRQSVRCTDGNLEWCDGGDVQMAAARCAEGEMLEFCSGGAPARQVARCLTGDLLQLCVEGEVGEQPCQGDTCSATECVPVSCETTACMPGFECVDSVCLPVRCEGGAAVGDTRCGVPGRERCAETGDWVLDACVSPARCVDGSCCAWQKQDSLNVREFRADVDADGVFRRLALRARTGNPNREIILEQVREGEEPTVITPVPASRALALAHLDGRTEVFWQQQEDARLEIFHATVSDAGAVSEIGTIGFRLGSGSAAERLRAVVLDGTVHVVFIDGEGRLAHLQQVSDGFMSLGGELALAAASIQDVLVLDGVIYAAVPHQNRMGVRMHHIYRWRDDQWTTEDEFPQSASSSMALASVDAALSMAYVSMLEGRSTLVIRRLRETTERRVDAIAGVSNIGLATVRGTLMVSYVFQEGARTFIRIAEPPGPGSVEWNRLVDHDVGTGFNASPGFSPDLRSNGERAYCWWHGNPETVGPTRAEYVCD